MPLRLGEHRYVVVGGVSLLDQKCALRCVCACVCPSEFTSLRTSLHVPECVYMTFPPLLPRIRATERALGAQRVRVKAGQGSTAVCTCLMAQPPWPWPDLASPSVPCWQASVRNEASLYLISRSSWSATSRCESGLVPNSHSFPDPDPNSIPVSAQL